MKRPPDQIIGDDYLHRWYVIPRNRFFNVYLHKFMHSDDDRALHDHPWSSLSVCLKGNAIEIYRDPKPAWWDGKHHERFRVIRPGRCVFRSATHAHRMELIGPGPTWTLFITGPKIREWGFHCPQGWRHWTEFTTPDGNGIGKGCD